jgi:spore germination protein Q
MTNYVNPNYLQQDDGDTPMGYQQYPGTGFQQPGYPGMPGGYPQGYPQYPGFPTPPAPTPTPSTGATPFFEQSYIENILRLNKGKIATVYMNFENSQWGSKVFKGVIEAAGKDHIILSDPVTGMRYVLLQIYLNYITFDEEIDYDYPIAPIPGQEPLGTSAPVFNIPTPTSQTPTPSTFPGQTQFRKKEQPKEKK